MGEALLIQTIYNHYGTDNNEQVFGVIKVTYPEGSVCTCTDGVTTLTAEDTTGDWIFLIPNEGEWTVSCTDGVEFRDAKVIITKKSQLEDIYLYYMPLAGEKLDKYTWDEISKVSMAGIASSYWSVGDCKSIQVSGKIGLLSLNKTYYVYILGFNHNDALNSIDFGTFKTEALSGIDVCLIDEKYNSEPYNAPVYFSMNHDSNINTGGWKNCALRYDILGSTDILGEDASELTAINPIPNTLMSALPSDLRSVMKPMTIYTDNTGAHLNSKPGSSADISATIDYLPLLAEFEVTGARKNANTYEQTSQKQYDYYINGNSQLKYRHDNLASGATWWVRSPKSNDSYSFCFISISGSSTSFGSITAKFGLGVAPIFRV